MDPRNQGFLDRLSTSLDSGKDRAKTAGWLIKNTTHPRDAGKPWSFQEHEYQIDIVNSDQPDVVGKKCAQVGFSEIAIRLALALAGRKRQTTVIYTLPTTGQAGKFSKERVDPIILASPQLRDLVDRDVNSNELKKIGDSFLHIRGAFAKRDAISVPAEIMMHDEVDFSDPETLTAYMSRVGHVKEQDLMLRRFSTPTVSGVGVSALFDDSTQHWYAVKCYHCGSWEIVKFARDVVIPGFSGSPLELEVEDLRDPRYDISGAYVACPRCKQPLTIENLADPASRMWVPAYPDRDRVGYQIQPFDVPTINPPSRTIKALADYRKKDDWVNFKLGQDFQDATNSFLETMVDSAVCLDWVEPRPNAATGTVLGIDVGKTSWIEVARPNEHGGLDTIHYERVRVDSSETLPTRAAELYDWYGAVSCVIDAGPDWTAALAVISKLPPGKAFACYYRDNVKTTMSFVEVKEEEKVVIAQRSDLISHVAKLVNTGKHRFARAPDQGALKEHLLSMKKVKRKNAKGDDVEFWTNTGPDHYAHANFFAFVAFSILQYKPNTKLIPALPLPGKARVRSEPTEQASTYYDQVMNG